MKGLHMAAWILLIIGGLNWLLEVFGWGIGGFVPGSVAKIIYLLVGLAALFELFTHRSSCKYCASGMSSSQPM